MLRREHLGAVDVVKRIAVVAPLVAAVAAVTAAAGPASGSQSVTFSVARGTDASSGLPKVRFTGAISTGAAGEDITVMQQTCGYSFATAIAGTQTRTGGAWDAEPATLGSVALSATYHARWRSIRSDPVEVHPQIPLFLIPVGKGRLRVSVSIRGVYQDMRGRVVLLERFRNKRWTVVRRQKLGYDPSGFSGSYITVFVTPKGWTVRARVPVKSAAPCFKPNATEKAVSS